VETDSLSPLVVRVYHEDKYLKLLTNEEAECVYDTTSCSYTFEDGIKMNNIDETSHYTDWDTAVNFYIKCKDAYGNKPFPDKCNLIAKPSQIFLGKINSRILILFLIKKCPSEFKSSSKVVRPKPLVLFCLLVHSAQAKI